MDEIKTEKYMERSKRAMESLRAGDGEVLESEFNAAVVYINRSDDTLRMRDGNGSHQVIEEYMTERKAIGAVVDLGYGEELKKMTKLRHYSKSPLGRDVETCYYFTSLGALVLIEDEDEIRVMEDSKRAEESREIEVDIDWSIRPEKKTRRGVNRLDLSFLLLIAVGFYIILDSVLGVIVSFVIAAGMLGVLGLVRTAYLGVSKKAEVDMGDPANILIRKLEIMGDEVLKDIERAGEYKSKLVEQSTALGEIKSSLRVLGDVVPENVETAVEAVVDRLDGVRKLAVNLKMTEVRIRAQIEEQLEKRSAVEKLAKSYAVLADIEKDIQSTLLESDSIILESKEYEEKVLSKYKRAFMRIQQDYLVLRDYKRALLEMG